MKILLVNSQFAPFHIELADATNAIPGVTFKLAFTFPSRRPYWRADHESPYCFCAPSGLRRQNLVDWLRELVKRERPSVVLIAGIRGAIYDLAADANLRRSTCFGFWLEQPMLPRPWLYRRLRDVEYRFRLRHASFILAIGDRAFDYYRRLCDRVAMVPYGQDLSSCFSFERAEADGAGVRFVFSGQLVPRHNIAVLMKAVERVYDTVGPQFTLVVAAYGPHQRLIDRLLKRRPELKHVIVFDREYEQWPDRLRPFATCDVLLYPSYHSGWGLVIPEAMAAGLLVISTRFVEAARHYIQPGVNGVLIEPTECALEQQMLRCIDDPKWVREVGRRARVAARAGDAPAIAARLTETVSALMGRAAL